VGGKQPNDRNPHGHAGIHGPLGHAWLRGNAHHGSDTGSGSDTSAEIAETTLLAMEAFAEPGWVSLSLALLSAGGGGLTDTLITAIAVDMEDLLIGLLFL
jgi:hypothetical protein